MFKKTVDGVLAKFNQTVQDLRAIGAARTAEIERIDNKTAALMDERVVAEADRQRANDIADKIASLIA